MNKFSACLWFDHQAEDAADFYTSIFKNSKKGKVSYYGQAGSEVSGQKKGSVLTVGFSIEGFEFTGLNGGPHFKFSPAISFFVNCDSESEIDFLWARLADGGQIMMELNKYPWAEKYGWVTDKFGVGWQLMMTQNYKQKIVPSFLFVNEKVGQAEEALRFYTSVFKDSKVIQKQIDEKSKTVVYASFSLQGEIFSLMESTLKHDFDFTGATSFMVNCRTQEEVDFYWDNLVKGGGQHSQCGWLSDKFGIHWQIIPIALTEMMDASDPVRKERVMKAMFKMQKLDIQTLKNAYQ